MNKRICTLALVLLMLLSTGLSALAQGVGPQGPADPQEVEAFADAFFAEKMEAYHIPGAAFVLVKVEPLLFQRVDGGDYLVFRENESGRISYMVLGSQPYIAYERLAWYETSPVHLGLLGFAALFFLSAILAGPIGYLVRRIRRRPPIR